MTAKHTVWVCSMLIMPDRKLRVLSVNDLTRMHIYVA